MEVKGYPDVIVFKTKLDNTVTISQEGVDIKVIYVTKDKRLEYKIVEGRHENLTMMK